MERLKKIPILFMSCIFLLCSTACGDKTWALKSDNRTISTSTYVYQLMQFYQDASDKLIEKGISTTDIKNEELEGQNASNWIKEHAIDSCKEMLAVDKILSDMNLSLADEEKKKAQEKTDAIWEASGEVYEKNFGINKDSVHQANSLFAAKKKKIFSALYGKDGINPVSDEQLLEYYKHNYISLKFYSKMPFEDADSEGGEGQSQSGKVDTEEFIEQQFSGYVSAINSGTKNINQIQSEIKATDHIENNADSLEDQLVNPNSTELPKEIVDAISTIEPGKATYVKYNDIYLFLYRNPNSNNIELPDLTNESDREKILYDMKSDDFNKKIEDTKNNLTINLNNDVINKYEPTMFSKTTN